jgi:hypothetical protein
MGNDFFTKQVIISLITFLLLEAFLSNRALKALRHFYLVTQVLVIFILSIEQQRGKVPVQSTAHVLMTYLSLASLYLSPGI